MCEVKHVIRGFEDYYEKYGIVFTDRGPLSVKVSDLRGLAWLAAITLRREYDFEPDDLIGSLLFTKNNNPTGLSINGVIWRCKQKRG